MAGRRTRGGDGDSGSGAVTSVEDTKGAVVLLTGQATTDDELAVLDEALASLVVR